MFFLVGFAMLLCTMRCCGNKKSELKKQMKSAVKTGICEFVKAVARVTFAFIYFHVFIAILIAVLWPNIEPFFKTVSQGHVTKKVLLGVVKENLLPILVWGMLALTAFELFLRYFFEKDIDSVFDTISWMGNTVLALIGILTIFYVLYPKGIDVSDVQKCLCAESTVAQDANKYLWAEGFLMFFGVAILDFYKVLSGRNIKKRYRCQNSGCEIVEEISEDF